MSWTANTVTQNGGSTVTWTTTGGALSTHDAIVVGPVAGNSGLRLGDVTVSTGPTSYTAPVTVAGGFAMAFRFSGTKVD